MKYFWWYLSAGMVGLGAGAGMPGAWLLLRPNGYEIAELAGVALLVGAAYVSPFLPRMAGWLAPAGAAGVAIFMVHAVVAGGEERRLAGMVAALAVAAGLVVTWLAVKVLRGEGVAGRPGGSMLLWTGLAVALLVACFWPWRGRRDPSRFLVPENYVGWVVVEYGVAGAPALRIRDGAREYAVPQSGRLRTSSKQEYGYALDDWESVGASGVRTAMEAPDARGGQVWRQSYSVSEKPGEPLQETEQFFVGTEAQFNELGDKTYPYDR